VIGEITIIMSSSKSNLVSLLMHHMFSYKKMYGLFVRTKIIDLDNGVTVLMR